MRALSNAAETGLTVAGSAIIELSPDGERLLADLDRALREIDDAVFAPLTTTERDTLNALLAQAVEHIATDCTQPPDGTC